MTPHPNTHINWPPLPEHDVEEWSESGITLRYVGWSEEKVKAYAESFCTEQAAEIADLKAQIDELMPLAKFGAAAIEECMPELDSLIERCGIAAVTDDCYLFAPNIEAAIEQLLKDEK
jgi:uncharacterized protein YaaN involved in tellurite resistance